jgi:hypothetical protein
LWAFETRPAATRYPNSFGAFVVAVSKPLEKNRTKVEEYLMNKLGLPKDQMCQLPYSLTQYGEEYAREDYKFSFCPGAVAIK